jgi:tetratricopeptide (TPR) repeat protein
MTCLDEQTVAAMIAGTLAPEQLAAADEHLAGCAECLELVAVLAHRPAPTPAHERYELGREIARGGMGRILEAHDRVLGRRVAIKRLRTPAAMLADRFAREMRLTARLQHPAIIPIYDAGVMPDGEAFYAMRMVSGKTLDAAVAGAGSLEARLAYVPAVIAVADAIAYAHGEGIIHRDLKPANVLVGPFGEVVILDWGIAKDLRATDAGDSTPGAPVAPDEPLTIDGAVMGTPGYMAPEQAEGRPGDERTDVYGLGGILYQVLAGRPPHGKDRGAPVPPLDASLGIPPDLVAIVTRAMAPDPAARYQSAGELSDDLVRFSAGRLVAAHRYSVGQLFRRFVARHRAAVAIGALAAVALAVVSTIAVRRVLEERRVAVAEREAAEGLVEFILRDLRTRLEPVGRIDVLAPVGERVEAYYERVGVKDDDDRLQRAHAQEIVGDARLATGDLDGALAAYRDSLAWVERGNGNIAARCHARQRIGDVLRARGDLAGAAEQHRACLETAPDPAGRAASLVELAAIAKANGDVREAMRLLDEARALAEPIGGKLLTKIDDDRGILATQTGDYETARVAYEANLARMRAGLATTPDDLERQRDLVVTLMQIGQNAELRGDLATAAEALGEARTRAEALARRDPANTLWQRDLAMALDHLGHLALARGDLRAALADLAASDAITRNLVARQPDNAEWRRDLGVGALTMAQVHRELGDVASARVELDRAREIFEALSAGAPAASSLKADLAVVLTHQGDLALAENRRADAKAAFDASLAIRRDRLAAADTSATRRELAEILLLLDRPDEAATVLEPLRASASTDPDLASLIADVDAARAAGTQRR